MERNVMGELNMYRQLGTRPNFSEIARRYGLDRHTVAKYWSGGEEPEDRRSDRASTFDAFADVIGEKAALPGVTKKAIHEFLLDRHPDAGLAGYNAFTQWCRAHSVECGRGAAAKANLELLESLARVADFELATPFRVYFCDPHSPWERPSNENTNGLIREFFPKGTGFADVADEEVERAQWLLNNRPRKVLGWKLPSEVMQEVLAECAMTG